MADLPQFARFWMICRKPTGPHSKSEPRQRYSTRADALADAKRLANHTDAPFIVLEAVEIVRPGNDAQGAML